MLIAAVPLRHRRVLAPSRAVILVAVLAITAVLGCGRSSDIQSHPNRGSGNQNLTGMLIETQSHCRFPEGCGPKWILQDERLNTFAVLSGKTLRAGDSGKIINAKGVQGDNTFEVSSYRVLSQVRFADLRNVVTAYLGKHYPCTVDLDGFLDGNIDHSWSIKGGADPVLVVDFTYAEATKPKISLQYDGRSRKLISETRLPDKDLCA